MRSGQSIFFHHVSAPGTNNAQSNHALNAAWSSENESSLSIPELDPLTALNPLPQFLENPKLRAEQRHIGQEKRISY